MNLYTLFRAKANHSENLSLLTCKRTRFPQLLNLLGNELNSSINLLQTFQSKLNGSMSHFLSTSESLDTCHGSKLSLIHTLPPTQLPPSTPPRDCAASPNICKRRIHILNTPLIVTTIQNHPPSCFALRSNFIKQHLLQHANPLLIIFHLLSIHKQPSFQQPLESKFHSQSSSPMVLPTPH